jgi:hypothetical protein
LGKTLLVETVSAGARNTIEKAQAVSRSTFWLTKGPQNDRRANAELFMRVATGEEFPAYSGDRHGVLRIGEQTGYRLGSVEGAICRSYVGLHFADDARNTPETGTLTATEFLVRIRHRLDEQEELQRVFREESLETRKFAYAIHDRSPDSKLAELAYHIQSREPNGVWICPVSPRGDIPPGFGFKGTTGGGYGYRR